MTCRPTRPHGSILPRGHGYETGQPTDERVTGIRSRDDFADYLLRVLGDFRESGGAEWENNPLDRFLDGLSAFALGEMSTKPGGQLRLGCCSPR